MNSVNIIYNSTTLTYSKVPYSLCPFKLLSSEPEFFKVRYKMLELLVFPPCKEKKNAHHDETAFELLYDKYAANALGFIMRYAETREQAEEFLMNVFLKVWDNIKSFNEKEDEEKKIMTILLLVCKPLYKNKKAA